MQAPLRHSRAPLLPADPTAKYLKIIQKYGFTLIHHVCLTTLHQEHQRYVAALAKADPTLHPSPFPFVKELTAQQQAAASVVPMYVAVCRFSATEVDTTSNEV